MRAVTRIPPAQTRTVRWLLRISLLLLALALPWLYSGPLPVIALACAATIGLRLLRASDRLWARCGPVLGAPRRDSLDDIWFASGVCFTYVWSAAEPLAYCIAILVLALADAAASCVRARCARTPQWSSSEHASAMGSFAFFVVAFLIASGALFAANDLRPGESLAAAALLAAITTGIEASMSDGLHRVFVPIGALVALELTVL